MKEAIGAAEENKFSEFSKKVKTSLDDKLRSNPKMKAEIEKHKKLEDVKKAFAAIADMQKPAEVKDETPADNETPSDDAE